MQFIFPEGYYTVEDMNSYIHAKMVLDKNYFVDTLTGGKAFLINIVYNTYYNKIELQCLSANLFPAPRYEIPSGATWSRTYVLNGTTYNLCPTLYVPNNFVGRMIGFSRGYCQRLHNICPYDNASFFDYFDCATSKQTKLLEFINLFRLWWIG